jgi:hypothetical protein
MERYIDERLFRPIENFLKDVNHVTLWSFAVRGKRTVTIRTTILTSEQHVKVEKMLLDYDFCNISINRIPQKNGKFTQEIQAQFQNIEDIKIPNELQREYLKGIARKINAKLELGSTKRKCYRLLNQLYINLQCATFRNEKYYLMQLPLCNNYSTHVSQEHYDVIMNILKDIPNICSRIVRIPCTLWLEDRLLIWNWCVQNQDPTEVNLQSFDSCFCIRH